MKKEPAGFSSRQAGSMQFHISTNGDWYRVTPGHEAPALEVHGPAPECALGLADLGQRAVGRGFRGRARKPEGPRTWRLVHGG
jgi:hypothetical protein